MTLIEISCDSGLETISISNIDLPDLGLKIKVPCFELYNYGWGLSSMILLRAKHQSILDV
jgi:hypothetical protein